MNTSVDDVATQLHQLAERWLKRPLTADEERDLAAFRSALPAGPDHGGGVFDQVKAQAAQAVDEGRQRAQAAIQSVLRGSQQVAQQVALEREQEDQAILKVVEAAKSLADLRPSALHQARDGETPGGRMVIAQIADRLANLVKAEVDACFEHQVGPLVRKIEAVVNTIPVPAAAATQSAAANTSDASQNPSDAPNR